MTQFIEKISKEIVMVLFTLIIGVLTAISLINTCYLNDNEHTYYTFQTGIQFIILAGVLLVLLLAFYKCRNTILPRLNIRYILLFSFLLGIFFVMITQVQPRADQKVCLSVAEQMHLGNYEAFQQGNYMQAYPQQVGIVLVYYLLGFVFGSHNIVALHVINIAAYTWFIYGIYHITKKLFHTETLANCAAILCIAFLPLLFYTSFIYGTMLGLAFSTAALYKAMDYMKERRGTDALLCALFAGLSLLVKKNYLIVIVALILILTLHTICRKQLRTMLGILLILLSCTCFTSGAQMVTEKISGTTIGEGLPSIAWVTMGLQDGGRACGWYNRYSVNVYQDNDNDSKKTAHAAKEDLKERIRTFASNPLTAASFFTKKTASQWSEPSFECFFIIKNPVMNMKESPLLTGMVSGSINRYLLTYLDLLQSVIYLGIFLFAVYEWKRLHIWDLLPAIVFIGGFLFHLFWEAKGQYTLCYFVLLFPYCLKGYSRLFYRVLAVIQQKKPYTRKAVAFSLSPIIAWGMFAVLFTVSCLTIRPLGTAVTKANATYDSYVASIGEEIILMDGTYRIKSLKGNRYLNFTMNAENTISASLTTKKKSTQKVRIREGKAGTRITIKKFKKQLGEITIKKTLSPTLERRKSFYSNPPKNTFTLIEHDDGSYSIKNRDDYALTYNSKGKITLEEYASGNKHQHWIFENSAALEPDSTQHNE